MDLERIKKKLFWKWGLETEWNNINSGCSTYTDQISIILHIHTPTREVPITNQMLLGWDCSSLMRIQELHVQAWVFWARNIRFISWRVCKIIYGYNKSPACPCQMCNSLFLFISNLMPQDVHNFPWKQHPSWLRESKDIDLLYLHVNLLTLKCMQPTFITFSFIKHSFFWRFFLKIHIIIFGCN